MKPFEALDSAIQWLFMSSRIFANVPGAVINKLPKSIRNSLMNLKSDDISEKSKRKEYWQAYSVSPETDEIIMQKKERLAFDEKILK